MHYVREDMAELRAQLSKGSIQRAYRALLSYMMGLRSHSQNRDATRKVSGIYQGHLDMSYFALFPPALKRRSLKVAIVFNYEAFRFEAWLAASNRRVQQTYWELFRDSQWPEYRVVRPATGVDSIVECDLVTDVDFSDPDGLTASIEARAAAFIADMEKFLCQHQTHDESEARS